MTEGELLMSPDLDAVVIETAVRDLVPTAQRCIDANKHVHLEKPGCESRKAFVRLFDSARQRGRHIQMGYMLRYNPAFEFCCRAVRDGWLGRIFEVTGSMSKLVDDHRRPEFGPNSGGAMFELGCHLIDAMIAILGAPAKVTPFSRATRDDRVLDNQTAVFEYPHAIATIRSSIVEPHGGDRRHFEVSGENGTIAIRPLEPPILHLSLQAPAGEFKEGPQAVELPAEKGRYHKQLQAFATIVRGNTQPQWSAEHDLTVHLAVLQASDLPTT
jgi:predicted dehydrogenase